jgi:RNA polymerase sigma-70 factor, ECF subfamily
MIDAAARGAWRELQEKLRPFILRRISSPSDADDVLQDVFVRMQRGLPELKDSERFGPWVYQVARSAIVDHHRNQAKRGNTLGAECLDELSADLGTENAVAEELASYMVRFVADLPSPYREALTLTELKGLSHKEAAEVVGTSLSAMKSRVQRGRVSLRKALEECCAIALDARGRVLGCEPRDQDLIPDCCKG